MINTAIPDEELVSNCQRVLEKKCNDCKYKYRCTPHLNVFKENEMDVRKLFAFAPDQFREIAKRNPDYLSFIEALENTQGLNLSAMNQYDKEKLFELSMSKE